LQAAGDYVKILVLQFEELYADLPASDLEELAQKLKHRLIDRYVKMQNRNITKALDAANRRAAPGANEKIEKTQ
jgi:hypothetical protein